MFDKDKILRIVLVRNWKNTYVDTDDVIGMNHTTDKMLSEIPFE